MFFTLSTNSQRITKEVLDTCFSTTDFHSAVMFAESLIKEFNDGSYFEIYGQTGQDSEDSERKLQAKVTSYSISYMPGVDLDF